MTASTPSCDAVLALAAKGWRVFPCKMRDQMPLVGEWPHVATSDPRQILAWYAQHPGCNWGIACGRDSGVWVLDVDADKGRESLKGLVGQYGKLPARLTVRTGKGLHLYFAWPTDVSLRNSAGKIGEGLDVRGEGGYVLAPGSVHPRGAVYTVAKAGPIPPADSYGSGVAAQCGGWSLLSAGEVPAGPAASARSSRPHRQGRMDSRRALGLALLGGGEVN